MHKESVLLLLLLGVYSTVGAAQVDESTSTSIPFVDPTTIDPRIPTPFSIIGHEVGEKAVRYDPLMRYLEALAASSDRITMNPYGKTHEGRTMVHLFITSPKNHQRLDQIVNGGVKVYHLAEQKCTTHSLYSRDRPGCQYSILTSSFLLPC